MAVATRAVRPLRTSSTSTVARIFTEPRPVSRASRSPLAHDAGPGGEVGALDEAQQVLGGSLGVLHLEDGGVDDLAQVVGRDVGGHAHRDAGGTIDQQVGEAGREHHRLLALPGVVVLEVDGVLVDALEQLHRQRLEAALGVAHRRRRVVDRAEVPLRLDEAVADGEVLAHADQGVVDGVVAVRVEPAHDVADHPGALAEGRARPNAGVVHGVEDPAVHRLQAVADVGQGPRDDDRHGVLEERGAHLALDVDEPHVLGVGVGDGHGVRCPGSGRRGRSAG